MTPPIALGAFVALMAVSALGLWLDRASRSGPLELAALLPLVPLAMLVTGLWAPAVPFAPLIAGLAIALLTRSRDDVLHAECALKLLWVLGPALAVSTAGIELLAIATGTTVPLEQWSVLAVPIEPTMLWGTALSLSLLAGFVLLGGAPFHFWPADVLQGARPWMSALIVSALQTCGAAWIMWRLEDIATLPEAASLAATLLAAGASLAFAIGAITLTFQRRPERRVGTLASLNGGLLLASLAVRYGPSSTAAALPFDVPAWSTHLGLALAGAGTLAPFLPVSVKAPGPGPVLFRRHPVWGALGLYALASLAGVPGTPGALIWFRVARLLVVSSRTSLLLVLALAWVTAFGIVVREVREAFGIRSETPVPPRAVPVPARWAMLLGGAGLVALAVLRRG